MTGAMWDVRGLNKTCRLQRTADFINKNKLDLFGFQETKRKNL
jgi:exonuclease III